VGRKLFSSYRSRRRSRYSLQPYGHLLASAGYEGTVRLWNAETGEVLGVFGVTRTLNNIAFSPDGRFLAAGVADGTVRIWGVDEP
jgi:WD40 repeat protein